MRISRQGSEVPCHCVYRAVFRACYGRFRECIAKGPWMGRVSLEHCTGRDQQYRFSRKTEDFMADFCLISRRSLDDEEHKLFRYHFLLGADWKLCCRYLNIDRGNFFHGVYRLEQKLGRAFSELEPYGLFPLDEYFGGTRNAVPKVAVMPVRRAGRVRPPVRKSA